MEISSPEYSFGERTSTSGFFALLCLQHLVAEGADVFVRFFRPILCFRVGWDILDERAVFLLPFGASAVHDLHVLVTVVLEQPQRIAGEPVGLVAVENDGRIVGDAKVGRYFFELLLGEEIAAHGMLQGGEPIHLHRAGM